MTRVLTSAAVNELRDRMYVLNPVTNLYERATLLEKALTNLCLQSENFGTTWVAVDTPTRTAAAHTASGVTLDLIGDDGAAAFDEYEQTITFTGDAVKSVSIHVKEGPSTSAGGSTIQLRDTTAGALRLNATITWVAHVPSVAITAAAGVYLGYESMADGVYRLLFTTNSVTAANTNKIQVYPAAVASNTYTGNVYAGGVQCEDSLVPTSYKKTTTGTVARSKDLLYAPYTAVPREATIYTKSVDRGTTRIADSITWQIGADAGPYLRAYIGGGSVYGLQYYDGANSRTSDSATAAWGNLVEHRAVIASTGAIFGALSINGGAETVGATSAALALPSVWTTQRVTFNNNVAGDQNGVHAILAFRIAFGVKTMAEMRLLGAMDSSVLVLNAGDADAITVLCTEASATEPTDVGDRTRAFDGSLRIATRSQKRAWQVTTAPMETVDKEALLELIENNVVLPCSGLLLENDTVNCSIKCSTAPMYNGHTGLWQLALTVLEV